VTPRWQTFPSSRVLLCSWIGGGAVLPVSAVTAGCLEPANDTPLFDTATATGWPLFGRMSVSLEGRCQSAGRAMQGHPTMHDLAPRLVLIFFVVENDPNVESPTFHFCLFLLSRLLHIFTTLVLGFGRVRKGQLISKNACARRERPSRAK
jgi:hypothetical protein